MAFRFRKSIKLAPGIRMNLSKSGIGLSAGVKGARIGVNSRGTYSSLSIPGTGISMLNYHGSRKSSKRQAPVRDDYVLTSEFGDVRVTHTARGIPKYSIEISHEGINKFQIIKGDSQEDVEQKACAKMLQWNEIWERNQALELERATRQSKANAIAEKKKLAAELTAEAQTTLAELDGILKHTLSFDDTINWDSLKGPTVYPELRPEKPPLPPPPSSPSFLESPGEMIPSMRFDRAYSAHFSNQFVQRGWPNLRAHFLPITHDGNQAREAYTVTSKPNETSILSWPNAWNLSTFPT